MDDGLGSGGRGFSSTVVQVTRSGDEVVGKFSWITLEFSSSASTELLLVGLWTTSLLMVVEWCSTGGLEDVDTVTKGSCT